MRPKLRVMTTSGTSEISAREPEDRSDGHAAVETDGRRRRRAHNREAVVEALLDLYAEGNLRPSTDEIADRAGLSPRSLFRYFADVDDLALAALRRQQARADPMLPVDAAPGDPLDARIRALVDQRFRLFDSLETSQRVVRLRAPFQPVLAAELARNRSFFRLQLLELFAPEVEATGEERAGAAIAAADVIASFESYVLLKEDQWLSEERAKDVMFDALRAVLDPGRQHVDRPSDPPAGAPPEPGATS